MKINLDLLILRVTVGTLMLLHGIAKLKGVSGIEVISSLVVCIRRKLEMIRFYPHISRRFYSS